MGAEIGATTSSSLTTNQSTAIFTQLTEVMCELAKSNQQHLTADPEVLQSPTEYFDQVIEIDLDKLHPHINGPHTPDLAREVQELGAEAKSNGWPLEISAALIGSCTNSSYEDITRAASIAREAAKHGLKSKCRLLITPGSEQVRATITRDGLLADFEAVGAVVLANACGPCIGQWDRPKRRTTRQEHRTLSSLPTIETSQTK